MKKSSTVGTLLKIYSDCVDAGNLNVNIKYAVVVTTDAEHRVIARTVVRMINLDGVTVNINESPGRDNIVYRLVISGAGKSVKFAIQMLIGLHT